MKEQYAYRRKCGCNSTVRRWCQRNLLRVHNTLSCRSQLHCAGYKHAESPGNHAEESRSGSRFLARATKEDVNLRSRCRKDLMPLSLREDGQSRGKEKCEQQNHANLDTAVLRHAEQHHDGRHQQSNGHKSDDKPDEDVKPFFGVKVHAFVVRFAAFGFRCEKELYLI